MTTVDYAQQLKTCFPHPIGLASYLANYSHKFSYLYVETPKVSCSTVKRALQLLEVGWDVEKVPADVHDRLSSPLPRLLDETRPLADFFSGPDFFRFAFVRNPFTRLLSAYLDKIVENEWERERLLPTLGLPSADEVSFHDFLVAVSKQPDAARDIHWMSQTAILQDQIVRYDVIGRFESFAKYFDRILERISSGSSQMVRSANIDHHRTNATQKVNTFIGRKEQNLIVEVYDQDFRRFCYSRDLAFADM